MRLRTNPSPFLLLLLPILTGALTVETPEKRQILEAQAPAPVKDYAAFPGTSTLVLGPTVKPAVGTKDAPVDGLDGKPHAGPFVDTTPSDKTKKPAAGAADAEKPLPTSLDKLKKEGYSSEDGWALIPEKNDGVMNDPNRSAPKQGTTGTEGGVTERTRKDKSLEGQLADAEKTVDPPKEAPPMIDSDLDQTKAKAAKAAQDVETLGDKVTTLTGKPKGAQGLEVSDTS